MNKLNYLGVGPKVGGIILPWLVAAIILTLMFRNLFSYFEGGSSILFFVGLGLVILGAIMYFLTAPLLIKGLRETKLITSGTFYLCCNPLYSSVILFIIPGVSLMMNSWLVLTTSVVGYVLFKIFIKREYLEMEKFFGDDFRNYRANTPEFIPFPIKKWRKVPVRMEG